jgi:hypothetical protein
MEVIKNTGIQMAKLYSSHEIIDMRNFYQKITAEIPATEIDD